MIELFALLLLQFTEPDPEALRATARLTELRIPACERELARGDRAEDCDRFLDTMDDLLGRMGEIEDLLRARASSQGISVERLFEIDPEAAELGQSILDVGPVFYRAMDMLALLEAAE
ncbi:hypothetical protein [Hyphobacterium sp.]|uniref:hypothetical protein n=1 Tax=Hyphobacterium sp. TaxID=2004662 RepID=UPI003BAB2876